MLLRKVKQHVLNENWFSVFIDFLIVVIGIFIGLQVTNWHETRKNQETSQLFLKRIEQDLREDASSFKVTLVYFDTVKNYGERVLEKLNSAESSDNADFIINAYQASQYIVTDYSDYSYKELINSGFLQFIKDEQIKKMLSNYYLASKYSTFLNVPDTDYRLNIRKYLSNDIQSLVKLHCGDVDVFSDDNYISTSLPSTCDISIASDVVSEQMQQLRKYPELEQDLNYLLSVIDVARRNLTVNIELADKIAKHLSVNVIDE